MSEPIPTKRRVEVSVGAPDLLSEAKMDKPKGMAHPDECYFMTFVDVPEKDDPDGCYNSFTAQVTCLCGMPAATLLWLQGGTEQEVQELLAGGHDGGHDDGDDDEADAGEAWKRS